MTLLVGRMVGWSVRGRSVVSQSVTLLKFFLPQCNSSTVPQCYSATVPQCNSATVTHLGNIGKHSNKTNFHQKTKIKMEIRLNLDLHKESSLKKLFFKTQIPLRLFHMEICVILVSAPFQVVSFIYDQWARVGNKKISVNSYIRNPHAFLSQVDQHHW